MGMNGEKVIRIIYKSKLGASLKYAESLASSLGADILPFKSIKSGAGTLRDADIVIFCTGIYMGRIDGFKEFSAIRPYISGRCYIAASCINPPNDSFRERIEEQNRLPDDIKLFLMRGKMDINKLGLFDSLVIKLMGKRLEGKKKPTPEERELLNALKYPTDFTDIRYTVQIVKEIREEIGNE